MLMLKTTHNAMIARIKKALGSENSAYNVLDLASNLRLDRDAAVKAKASLANDLAAANKALKFADAEAVKLRKHIEELESAKKPTPKPKGTTVTPIRSLMPRGKAKAPGATAKVPVKGKVKA